MSSDKGKVKNRNGSGLKWFQHPNPISFNRNAMVEDSDFVIGIIEFLKQEGRMTKDHTPHLKVILYHCMLSAKSGRPVAVRVKKRKQDKGNGETALNTVIKRMRDSKLLDYQKGYSYVHQGDSELSRIRPVPNFGQRLLKEYKPHLVDIEHPRILNIKDDKKKVTDRQVLSDQTNDAKAIILYNEYIKQQRIECMLLAGDFKADDYLYGFAGTYEINSQVARIFTNVEGDGGRLYNLDLFSVQHLSEDVRGRITINGSETIELDFKALHPSMLYHMQGLAAPLDAYDIFQDDPDRKLLRNCVKPAFNILINSVSQEEAIAGIQKRFNLDDPAQGIIVKKYFRKKGNSDDSLFAKLLLLHIAKAHQPIKKYFCSGSWKWLQNKDADMMLFILSDLRNLNIPALSVHDSIIIKKQDAVAAHDVMKKHYFRFFGYDIVIDGMPKAA